jgi:thiol-disulfide isomerase/thioredoxin
MRNNIKANVELGAQIVIAIAVIVTAGVLIKRSFFPGQPNLADLPRINAGERLNVPNVDWKQNKKSLVFFLKKDCAYCASSAPFYRQLIAEASKRNVTSLAILPNSIDEANKYLKYLELPIENVQTGSLSSYKIPGTPTVLFVNSQGIVRSAWFGVAPGREKEMHEKLVELFDANSD